MINKSKVLFLIGFVFVCITLYSQDNELVTRYLTAANNQYSEGNIPKAFSYINIVLSSFSQDTTPQNVEALSETIYFSYLENIKTTKDWQAFSSIKEKLIEFPFLSSERIARTVKVLNTYESQDASWGSTSSTHSGGLTEGSAGGPGSNQVQSNILELQLALEKVKADTTEETNRVHAEQQKELLQTQKDVYERALLEVGTKHEKDNRMIVFVLIAIAGISLIVFASIIINVLISLKNYKEQNQKFTETLKAVSEMNAVQSRGNFTIPSLPSQYHDDENIRYLDSSLSETIIPSEPQTEAENKELEKLALACREIGTKIDAVTARKNNSQNVAELTFKISQEMGFSQYESTLFFSIAMVYDIGFLYINPDLLLAPELTEDQKNEIRGHVRKGISELGFVPKKYLPIFEEGVLKHHENIDGSGYPDGLQGFEIPYIARLLRVAESFVSLISKRSYRNIYDKEAAIDELKTNPNLYDNIIVEVLEKII